MSPSQSTLDRILLQRKVIITCGTGGVGKTTLSAALAIRASLLGRNAVVITIDPAKRLATSLGLQSLGDEGTDLTSRLQEAVAHARQAGWQPPAHFQLTPPGRLEAIIPDTRQTFEAFLGSLSPSPGFSERVMKNPIFQIFAREFSGTNEYMALERLAKLHSLQKYDTIILDTPPSRDTLAFLDAPQLLARFFEERLINWLVMPANRLVSAGMKKAMQLLEKLTGSGFMANLFDFASALFEVRLEFTANLKRITALLQSEEVGFLLVSAPAPQRVSEMASEIEHFVNSVRDHEFHFEGVVLNRSFADLEASAPLAEQITAEANPQMKAALTLIQALQNRELGAASRSSATPGLHAQLPELARDVHSVEDLLHVAMEFDRSPDRS